jgi:hypothetical protein
MAVLILSVVAGFTVGRLSNLTSGVLAVVAQRYRRAILFLHRFWFRVPRLFGVTLDLFGGMSASEFPHCPLDLLSLSDGNHPVR